MAEEQLFLTAQQLRYLTGYEYGAYQVKWLRASGVRHYVNADGKPRVLVSALENPSARKPPVQPDFTAVKQVN